MGTKPYKTKEIKEGGQKSPKCVFLDLLFEIWRTHSRKEKLIIPKVHFTSILFFPKAKQKVQVFTHCSIMCFAPALHNTLVTHYTEKESQRVLQPSFAFPILHNRLLEYLAGKESQNGRHRESNCRR